MEETRVAKYKKYRQSLSKDGSPVLETPKSSKKKDASEKAMDTTSTLPIDVVINSLDEDKKQVAFLRKRKWRRILLISACVLGGLLLIAGIIVFACLVFH